MQVQAWDCLQVKRSAFSASVGLVSILGRVDRVLRATPIRALGSLQQGASTPAAVPSSDQGGTTEQPAPVRSGVPGEARSDFAYRRPKPKVRASMSRESHGAGLSRERRESHFHSDQEAARRKRYEEALLVSAPAGERAQ